MNGILRSVWVVAVVGCSLAEPGPALVEPQSSSPAPVAWTARSPGVFIGASHALAYEWANGQLTVRRRDVDAREAHRPHRDPRKAAATMSSLSLETTSIARESALVPLPVGTPSIRADGALLLDRGVAVERLEQRLKGLSQSWRFASKPTGAGDLVLRVRTTGATKGHADGAGLVLGTADRAFRYGIATWVDARGETFTLAATFDGEHIEIRVPSAIVDASTFPATLDPIVSAENFGPPQAAGARVAGLGSSFVAVWQDFATSTPRVVSARVDEATGKVQSPFAVPVSGASAASEPAIAAASAKFLVAYEDNGATSQIRARWLDASGVATGADFAVSAASDAVTSPRVACGATRCLVVWQEFSNFVAQVRAAYVTIASSAVSSVVALTSSADEHQGSPDVATDGTKFMVTWLSSTEDGDIVSSALLSDATFSVVPVETTATWYRSFPRVAFAAGRYFVTYADDRSAASVDLFAKRLDATTGAVLDGSAISIASGAGDEDYPVIGGDASRVVIAYADGSGIRDAVLSPDGSLVASAWVSAETDVTPEAIAPATSYYLALWSGGGSSYGQAFGARVRTSDGQTLDPAAIGVSNGPGACTAVTVNSSLATPSAAGTAVTFTATSTCVDAAPEYQFWVETPGLGFSLLRDFGPSPSAIWSTTELPTDAYRLVVRGRRAGLFANWESEAELFHGIVGANGVCSQLSASASPSSFTMVGSPVTVTGVATCSASASAEYQFQLVLPNGVSWLLQDWGSSSYVWDTTAFPQTSVSLQVRSRRVGSDASFEAETSVPMLVFGGPGYCPIVELQSASSVVSNGATVSLAASAVCSGGAAPEYEFVVRPPSGSVQVLRGYGPSGAATFAASAGVAGRYRIWVRARRAGSTLPFEARAGTTIFVQ